MREHKVGRGSCGRNARLFIALRHTLCREKKFQTREPAGKLELVVNAFKKYGRELCATLCLSGSVIARVTRRVSSSFPSRNNTSRPDNRLILFLLFPRGCKRIEGSTFSFFPSSSFFFFFFSVSVCKRGSTRHGNWHRVFRKLYNTSLNHYRTIMSLFIG